MSLAWYCQPLGVPMSGPPRVKLSLMPRNVRDVEYLKFQKLWKWSVSVWFTDEFCRTPPYDQLDRVEQSRTDVAR